MEREWNAVYTQPGAKMLETRSAKLQITMDQESSRKRCLGIISIIDIRA